MIWWGCFENFQILYLFSLKDRQEGEFCLQPGGFGVNNLKNQKGEWSWLFIDT